MKNLKKVLSLVLALAMALSLMTAAFAADAGDYKDYNEVTYKEAVDVMTAAGVFNGSDSGNFNPTDTLNREQAAKIITYMLLGQKEADKLTATVAPYADVAANRWSAGAIAYCTNEGIIAGDGNGKFNPTDKVLGVQFAKMLLVALGYDPQIEQLVGNSWAINISKLAITAGLADDLDISLNSALTREQAAQMAFNAMTARMVDYTGGTNITTPDGTTIVVDADRYYVGHTTTTGYRMDVANDEYTQFCEQYASKLKLNKGSSDDLDRPSNEWVFENKSIGTYAQKAAVVYTADMNTDSGKKTVKNDLKNYYYGNTNDAGLSSTGNVSAVSNIDSSDEVAALTENGRSVEIYVTDNVITDIVAIDSKLVEVKKVAKDEVTLTGGANKIEDDHDLFAFFSDLEKDDEVVVVLDDNNDVVEAYEPEYVTGKYTKNKGSGDTTEYTIGGEVYQKAKGVAGLADGDINDTLTLTLDQYGYILAVDTENVADDVYAYVLDYSANNNRGDYDYALKLLFTDGTTKWVDVAELDDDVVADGDVTAAEMEALVDNPTFVSFNETDDGYDITSESSDTDAAKTGAITKGDSSMLGYTASNKTIFLVKKDGAYTVYTGIKNVPSMNIAAAGDAMILKEGAIAKIVVIDEAATTSNEDQVFIYDTASQGTEADNSTTIKYYNAIVNGEDTTIGVSDTAFHSGAVNGLYLDNSYTDEYISSTMAGNLVNTTSEVDTGDVRVYKQSTTLTDIKLKNGILTVGASKTFVMADEYESWIVKLNGGTGGEVDTLALSSDGIVADGEIVLASGDYVIVILDDDGYVTDLYLVDANA